MSVYMVIEIKIKDQKLYSDYVDKVYDIITAYEGKYIVRGGTVLPISNNWNPERVIIIEFPSIEQMQNCFQSSQYLEIASLREQSTISKAIAIEGYSKTEQDIVNIRPAILFDAPQISKTHQLSINRLCKHYYSIKEIKAWTDILTPNIYKNAIQNKSIIVAEQENQILGLGIINITNNELGAIYIHPDHTGKGIGKKILLNLENIALKNNITKLNVCSTINACGFYKHYGYIELSKSYHTLSESVKLECIKMQKNFNA